jgi:hypothetical protein
MRILFVTSWNTACGIATYSANLIQQLEKLGVEVEVFSGMDSYTELSKMARYTDVDVVHFQHEFGLYCQTDALMSVMGKLRSMGKAVVITFHTEDSMYNVLMDGMADAIILHNDLPQGGQKRFSTSNTFSHFYRIPHGIPEISFSQDKAFYRRKYGIPSNAFVMGTCGFLAKHGIEEVCSVLSPFIGKNPNIYLNLVTSAHGKDFHSNFAKSIEESLMRLADKHGFSDRITVGLKFTPVQEFRERIYTLDLGFALAKPFIASNSGSVADLVSCGVPVVANDAPHFCNLKAYIKTINTHTAEDLVTEIKNIYENRNTLMPQLNQRAKGSTKEMGYSVVAQRHLEVYNQILSIQRPVIAKQTESDLNKELPIEIKIPSDLWQALLLWTKLQEMALEGDYKINLVCQNDGATDISILKYVLCGLNDVIFDNVGMGKDPYLTKSLSKTVRQKSSIDLISWFRKGYAFKDLWNNLSINKALPLNLGTYALNKADKLVTADTYVINLTRGILHELEEIMKGIPKEGKILVICAPLQDSLLDEAKKIIQRPVSYLVEDTRSRWAICDRVRSKDPRVFTAWDDVAAFCLVSGINTKYIVDQDWQKSLLMEFDVPKENIRELI